MSGTVQSTSLDAPLFHRGFVARRPQAVRDDIQFKFKHATSVSRWVQDSAANYVFGEFGSGLEIVRKEAIRLAAEGKTLSVLDAGCGSGGQLAEIAELMSKLSLPVYLRGVTAERSEVVPSLHHLRLNFLCRLIQSRAVTMAAKLTLQSSASAPPLAHPLTHAYIKVFH